MSVLALEFRPKTFADTVGQRHVLPILRSFVRDPGGMPPALLFGGTRGTGKTTTARVLAAALNCQAPIDGDCCAACPPCLSVQAGTSLAVIEVDAASNGLVDDVRRIKEMVSYEVSGQWRMVVLDEAHSMSRSAFNALLKVLEEPPANTSFVLLTTEVRRIPETVASRAMSFTFKRLTLQDIVGRLAHISEVKGLGTQEDLLVEIATRAQGGLRDAVMALDQCSRINITTVDAYRDLLGITDVAVPLFRAAVTADYAAGSQIVDDYFYRVGDAQGMVTDLVMLVRDLITLRSHDTPDQSEPLLDARRELITSVDLSSLVKVMAVLWELKERTRAVDNDHRASMEMAFVLIVAALGHEEAPAPIHEVGAEERPLSFDEMKALSAKYRQVREAAS